MLRGNRDGCMRRARTWDHELKDMNGQSDSKRNFKLVLEYDGGPYHGWQRQHGVLSVQEVLESRLEIMLRTPVGVKASGRTDAGVHAKGQVINFHSRTSLQPGEIQRGLNSLLPPDIVVLHAEEVPHSFHARFSARSKTYEYRILNRAVPAALERQFTWHIRQRLDEKPMQECLERIRGQHDFAAFMASGSPVKSTERCIFRAELQSSADRRLHFTFEADGFLRHMIRNLVGTLVDAGRGKLTPADFSAILAGKDRRMAGMTAPARGLCLLAVHYELNGESLSGREGER
jgi:tRNA pseudouridine38-40 synthase